MMNAQVAELPYVTAKSLRTLGKIRTVPEDFRVVEVPAYPPSGQGGHLFVQFEKRNLTSREAVTRIARGLRVRPGDAGVAGQKDKFAVTTQWASFAGATPEAALDLHLTDIRILSAVPHPHKLRTGHVRANQFELIVRGTTACDEAREVLAQLEAVGVPNYYGEQRFGMDGRNAERARAILRGEAPTPRDAFDRKLMMSAFQSSLFNAWLAGRIVDGLFTRSIVGDIMRKESSGGLFVNRDNDTALVRMQGWEISPTGPMFGVRMQVPEADAAEREASILHASGVNMEALAQHAKWGEGTRRSARVRPSRWQVDCAADALCLHFELPSGAYATTVLREIVKPEQG